LLASRIAEELAKKRHRRRLRDLPHQQDHGAEHHQLHPNAAHGRRKDGAATPRMSSKSKQWTVLSPG
jgi:hypothetical protein